MNIKAPTGDPSFEGERERVSGSSGTYCDDSYKIEILTYGIR